MRELLFRAYRPAHKDWIYCSFMGRNPIVNGDGPMSGPDEEIGPWLQYTGIVDKNGKQIYEGDILRYRISGDPDRQRPVYFSEELAAFRIGPDDYWESDRIYPESCEVIGNIYENKELLK